MLLVAVVPLTLDDKDLRLTVGSFRMSWTLNPVDDLSLLSFATLEVDMLNGGTVALQIKTRTVNKDGNKTHRH